MNTIQLSDRTAEHVRIFWERTQDEEIERLFPFSRSTLEDALRQYEQAQMPGAASFGQVILYDGCYVGDVWCYGIDEENEKQAFVSIVMFDKGVWGKGVGSEALRQFCTLVFQRFRIDKLCAFAFKTNTRSERMLKKTGFAEIEEFEEDGVPSCYYELPRPSMQ